MGGVGKTTLAKAVFDKISCEFEICDFVKISEDNRNKKEKIQKEFRNKRGLLVLDDANDDSQLEGLVGGRAAELFGEGSRIIITTRDNRILTLAEVDKQRIYEMKTMKEDESLRLFSNKAFRKDDPEKDYLELSESMVAHVGGLPLALEVLGNSLFRISKAVWIDALDRLKKSSPDKKILESLKISYDGLQHDYEKTIFLDVACLFKGWGKREVTQIFKSCDLNPIYGIEVLIEKALLVETEFGTLEVHDLLEDLGKYIVREESLNDVGERSRLWEFKDIKEVLKYNKGSKKIEAIVMGYYSEVMGYDYYSDEEEIKVDSNAFSNMSNLRIRLIFRWKRSGSSHSLTHALRNLSHSHHILLHTHYEITMPTKIQTHS